jgi:hypothetical protein
MSFQTVGGNSTHPEQYSLKLILLVTSSFRFVMGSLFIIINPFRNELSQEIGVPIHNFMSPKPLQILEI